MQKGLTILIGMPGELETSDSRQMLRDRLKQLGIQAKVNPEDLFLVTFKNRNDLHLFLISDTVVDNKQGPARDGTGTYNGYRVYEWSRKT